MGYLINRYMIKIAAQFALGINNPEDYGDVSELTPGELVNWVVQEHKARRAGRHYDVRFGKDKLFSFATKKEFPEPGKQIALYPQPLHEGSYAKFEGKIKSGYGAGEVKTRDKGEILVTKASPRRIQFVLAHKGEPEAFNLTKIDKGDDKPFWLMRNITPTEPVEYKKTHYKKIPAGKIDKLMDPDYVMSAKIDGAAGFARLMKDHVDVLSYRTASTGKPIVHTFRMGLLDKLNIPKHLQGKVFRGEIYGVRGDTEEAIPPQELGGLLNSSVSKSLRRQRDRNIKLRMALFGVVGDKSDFAKQEYEKRREAIREALKYLPKQFTEPPYAVTKAEKRSLWNAIKNRTLPLTHEGVVGFPVSGGVPVKVKLLQEHDVYIRKMFEGTGKYSGAGVGGFEYSLTPKGPIVGRVGTGFSDELRRDMYEESDKYIGRIAKVRAQGVFPSGALRTPALIAVHEDYSTKHAYLIDRNIEKQAGFWDWPGLRWIKKKWNKHKEKERISDVKNTVGAQARGRKTIRFKYTNQKGESRTREVEPYEIKGGYLWGADVDRNRSIRRYKLSGITNPTPTKNKYEPKWEVKIN